jgi:DNA (cytosine-5)-methyltransferase 1
MASPKHGIRYIDLFAGCGGLSDGFEATSGFRGVAHIEWEAAACKTLAHRLEAKWGYADAQRRVVRTDVQQLGALFAGTGVGDFPSHAGLDKLIEESGGVDLLIGGPPCQAYSMAGRVRDEHGMHRDYRNYLFESYLGVVKRYRPRAVLFENVPGMLSAKPGGVSISDRIGASFREAGYSIRSDLRSCLVDAAEYGVPQRRRRVIIVGVRTDVPDAVDALEGFYGQLLSERDPVRRSVSEAIGHLPRLMPLRTPKRLAGRLCSHDYRSNGIGDHVPRFHSVRDQAIFKMLAQDAQRAHPKYATAESLKALYTKVTGRVSAVHKYHVLRPDQPSNLIPAHLYKDGLRHIHFDPNQARSITVREAALLQGFPADFAFLGAQGDKYKMIGNAVPPLLAEALARAARKALFHDLAHDRDSSAARLADRKSIIVASRSKRATDKGCTADTGA